VYCFRVVVIAVFLATADSEINLMRGLNSGVHYRDQRHLPGFRHGRLHIQILYIQRILFDELPAALHVFAH